LIDPSGVKESNQVSIVLLPPHHNDDDE